MSLLSLPHAVRRLDTDKYIQAVGGLNAWAGSKLVGKGTSVGSELRGGGDVEIVAKLRINAPRSSYSRRRLAGNQIEPTSAGDTTSCLMI